MMPLKFWHRFPHFFFDLLSSFPAEPPMESGLSQVSSLAVPVLVRTFSANFIDEGSALREDRDHWNRKKRAYLMREQVKHSEQLANRKKGAVVIVP
mmetsp:Transcript_22216/g.35716  ORF Transcript_22216/g.35716 Transcript_22216/m.35716 type:complete len:96 (-) Transcript_22216:155-442(-)